MTVPAAWQALAGAVQLRVRLTPKSACDAIEGVETLSDGTPVLKVRVRAVPEDGKANTALIALIAKALSVRKGDVSLAGGSTSRLKTIVIATPDTGGVIAHLETLTR